MSSTISVNDIGKGDTVVWRTNAGWKSEGIVEEILEDGTIMVFRKMTGANPKFTKSRAYPVSHSKIIEVKRNG
jgi:hypothetical protein